MRTNFLPFALPDLDEREFTQIQEALTSGWITTGPKTRQFEAEFAASVGAKHAIAVNSCTAAMHLALEAIGLKRGDEVITSPYTFAATAEVVRYFDAKPVLVDITAEDFNIDPHKIERAITPRTRAIIPIHIAGKAADMDRIYTIAAQYNLAVIEDAAHAYPTRYQGRIIGATPTAIRVPSAVCFSFYATKTLTTGEGGMICTDSDEIADRCRIMALHGISRDAWKRYTAEGTWFYEIIAPGYKYNLSDVASAMGLAQLAKAEEMWQRRAEIANIYNEAFAGLPQLQIPCGPTTGQKGDDVPCEQWEQHAWHLYMVRLNLAQLRIDRNEFIVKLKEQNIGTSVHFIPIHLHPYYRETYGYKPEEFPIAYQEYQREISLPIYSKMTDQDTTDVIKAVTTIVEQNLR